MAGRGLKLILESAGRVVKLNRDELDDALMTVTPGKVFYVNGNDDMTGLDGGSDAGGDNDGLSWEGAFATINTAIAACVSGRGDVIVVLGGDAYTQNVVVDKDFVTIVGVVAAGYARPDVVPVSGKAFSSTAQGTVVMHMRLAAPAADTDLVLQEGNGFKYIDVVFDGDATMGNAKALLRLKGKANDDAYTASEGAIEDCLFRGSGGAGVIFDAGNGAGNQVGATHNVFKDCLFDSNDQADVVADDTSAGPAAYAAQNNRFIHCMFGLGTGKNKATHIDLDTDLGAANGNNVFIDCYFNDDTPNTTAFQINAIATNSMIGCYSMVGLIDGSGLD